MAHRGKHPNDDIIFSDKEQLKLREAVKDLSFLLERGYGLNSCSVIVGNRYALNSRQIKAMIRISCSASEKKSRIAKRLELKELKGKEIEIDGYNLLITLESALSGAYVFECMDSCYRDVAAIHGTYKRVEETIPALELIGKTLLELKISHARWFLDAPVSNSGRLKTLMYETADKNQFNWDIELVNNPDKTLAERNSMVVSSDSWIIDNVDRWFNLSGYIIEKKVSQAEIVKL